jgi:formylglycine-generating enzyme required for sulfatase activity
MAPIRRADGCYWIDTTEVTEAQYAQYLMANPTPVNDALCSATPDPDAQCVGRAPADAASGLPMTCVDWCDATAFCQWAGKTLCRDDFTAVGSVALDRSDFVFACTESGTDMTPYDPNCGEQACNVGRAGPLATGQIGKCWVHGADGTTPIYDLIGNVEEWTQSCHSNVDPRSECTVRGGSFARSDELSCCAQKTQLFRRRRIPTLGFRCCAYP